MEKTRAQFLAETLESDPANAFVRYALAMELSNSEELSPAWRHFEHLLTHQPEYLATYYQAGKFLARQGRVEEARNVLAKGIEVARGQGQEHARSELEAALNELAHP